MLSVQLKVVRRICHFGSFRYTQRRHAIDSAPSRQRGVDGRRPCVHRQAGIQTQNLIQCPRHILHTFELSVRCCPVRSNSRQDFGTQLLNDVASLCQFKEEPTEGGGGGVAAGEKDADDLVPQPGWGAGGGSEGVQEGVGFVCFLVGVVLVELGRWNGEGFLDELIDAIRRALLELLVLTIQSDYTYKVLRTCRLARNSVLEQNLL